MYREKCIKKNVLRVVSTETNTKKMFETRVKEFSKQKPTSTERKTWDHRIIRDTCRQDYYEYGRTCLTRWVQKIEASEQKDDTREIYRGVNDPSGTTTTSAIRSINGILKRTKEECKS